MSEPENPNPLNAYPDHVRVNAVAYYNALKRINEATRNAMTCVDRLTEFGVDAKKALADVESVLGPIV